MCCLKIFNIVLVDVDSGIDVKGLPESTLKSIFLLMNIKMNYFPQLHFMKYKFHNDILIKNHHFKVHIFYHYMYWFSYFNAVCNYLSDNKVSLLHPTQVIEGDHKEINKQENKAITFSVKKHRNFDYLFSSLFILI